MDGLKQQKLWFWKPEVQHQSVYTAPGSLGENPSLLTLASGIFLSNPWHSLLVGKFSLFTRRPVILDGGPSEGPYFLV